MAILPQSAPAPKPYAANFAGTRLPFQISRLRDITIDERARHTPRMQKWRPPINVQLTNVIADTAGETGMNIIRAIVAGERGRMKLAQLRKNKPGMKHVTANAPSEP